MPDRTNSESPDLRLLNHAVEQVGRRKILTLAVTWAIFWLPGLLPVAADAQAENESIRFPLRVQEIEAYLNNIKTVRARFQQVSSTGDVAEGYLYIQRPGRIRVEYDPPVPIVIGSDESFLIYYDRQLGQVTYLPLSSTPASILTRENIALEGSDIMITGFERQEDTLRLTLVLRSDPRAGSITLIFDPNPVRLKMWSLKDAQGVITRVSFRNAEFNVQLDQSLFKCQKN